MEPDSARGGPLAGVRVLDLTRVIMGPLATQILADQGADVILVESASQQVNRVMGAAPHPELSGTALNLLRNKRSIRLDLGTDAGRRSLDALVRTCDVVVTTMRPSALTALRADYGSLRRLNSSLIYCQAQGYPLGSGDEDEPAYDDVIQAATGLADVMGRVGEEPALVPTILADKVCGLVIAQAVTAALFHRERSGEGQHVEVSMREAMVAFMLVEHGDGGIAVPPVSVGDGPLTGYKRVLSKERRPHPTLDGYVHLFPYLPEHYIHLFRDAGWTNVEGDPRYADRRATLINSDSLYRDVRRVAGTRTTDEWLEYCRRRGIPATRVMTLDEIVAALPVAKHPAAGLYHSTPLFAKFGSTPGGIRRHAPLIGEHTEEVLAEVRPIQTVSMDPPDSAIVTEGIERSEDDSR